MILEDNEEMQTLKEFKQNYFYKEFYAAKVYFCMQSNISWDIGTVVFKYKLFYALAPYQSIQYIIDIKTLIQN